MKNSLILYFLYQQEAGRHRKSGEELTFSALDEDDSQTIVVENKLGCDIYLKKKEENMRMVDLLRNEESASVWIPPPRFADRLMVADEFREARNYVAIQILEAKVLHITCTLIWILGKFIPFCYFGL